MIPLSEAVCERLAGEAAARGVMPSALVLRALDSLLEPCGGCDEKHPRVEQTFDYKPGGPEHIQESIKIARSHGWTDKDIQKHFYKPKDINKLSYN